MKNVNALPGEITTDSQSQPWASLDWTVEQSGLVVLKIVTGFPPVSRPAVDDDTKTRAVILFSVPIMVNEGQEV